MAIYRFARFEFDSATGELVREGRCVRLRPQPARVLEHLLVRHGGLVGREELRRSIWPDGTYVHFDLGLNSCIKQIRAALAVSDPSTDYVETLVKRGFRFAAAVERVARRVDLPPPDGRPEGLDLQPDMNGEGEGSVERPGSHVRAVGRAVGRAVIDGSARRA